MLVCWVNCQSAGLPLPLRRRCLRLRSPIYISSSIGGIGHHRITTAHSPLSCATVPSSGSRLHIPQQHQPNLCRRGQMESLLAAAHLHPATFSPASLSSSSCSRSPSVVRGVRGGGRTVRCAYTKVRAPESFNRLVVWSISTGM
jgi:hypothetical protein